MIDDHLHRLKSYSGKTTPLHHRLPRELLDHIFCCTLENGFISPSQDHSPLKLAMICKDWRDIALSHPRLWSSVLIDIRLESDLSSMKPALPLLRLWLARSVDTLVFQNHGMQTLPAGLASTHLSFVSLA